MVKSLGYNNYHFHNLRDTYAIKRWIETGDIHLVSKEIGHASVTMTEKYANFNLRRLVIDFPTLSDVIKSRINEKSSIINSLNVLSHNQDLLN